MKNRSTKIAFLFALYAMLHFVQACNKVDCDCADVLPFFDYKALKVGANTPTVSADLNLKIETDSIGYLAVAPEPELLDFNIMSSAWACDCAWDGYSGPKYGIQSLNIYANRDFNDTLPTGTSLNPIFYEDGGDVSYLMLPDHQPNGFWKFDFGIRPIQVYTYEQPTQVAVPFVFTVQVVKTNGDTLRAETGEIYFL